MGMLRIISSRGDDRVSWNERDALFIMVFTAIGGAATIVSGFLLLFGQIHTAALQYGFAAAAIRASWIWSLVVIVLAVVGFMTQWRTMREYTLEWSEQSMHTSPS